MRHNALVGGRRHAALAAALGVVSIILATTTAATAGDSSVPQSPCGPADLPETGLQGQVPKADRDSGRSAKGYRCNLELIGQFQGDGATWVQPTYDHCAYIGTFAPGPVLQADRGVKVIDVSDEHHPTQTATLSSPAMLTGTWESLKVDPVHGYLAATGVQVPPGTGLLTFDLYDIKSDCAHPKLLNGLVGSLTVPAAVVGHEGLFSPDGTVYYALSAVGGFEAIDVRNPRLPITLGGGVTGLTNHGASISPDGKTMYGVTMVPSGVQILDISDFQAHKPLATVRQIGAVTWNDGLLSQHTINFTRGGHPYLYAVDEGGGGGVRLIDIADPTHPSVARQYRLAVNQPFTGAAAAVTDPKDDTGGDGIFGYDAHYCSIDKPVDPTMLACSYFQSGVRLFDITDPMSPRELGYYNPPAQVGREAGTPNALVNSAHAWTVYTPDLLDPQMYGGSTVIGSLHPSMTTDWCTSPPTFKPNNTLWVTCQDNGFQVLRYAPASVAAPAVVAPKHLRRHRKQAAHHEHSGDHDGAGHGDHHHSDHPATASRIPRAVNSGVSGSDSWLAMVVAGLGAGALEVGSLLWRRSTT